MEGYAYAVLPSFKSDLEISKSDFYQTIFLTKITIFKVKSDLFQKLDSDIEHDNFYLSKVHAWGNNLVIFCFVQEAEKVKIKLKSDFSGKREPN